jgi:beta-glucosidase
MKKITVRYLSNEEKAVLTQGKNDWENNDLGGKLPTFTMSDGPMGVRSTKSLDDFEHQVSLPSIAYPCAECLSQTWNLDLAKEFGNALANDCIERGIDIILGPGTCIKRVPTCGRNFEYFSEDPLLAGLFAKATIEGIQAKHIGACVKHYCCNNIEFARNYISSEVDERTLREIYLKPFEIAVEAQPWELMCSYNLVNGVKMAEHQILFTVLRDEFHFAGLIVSDWGAVFDPKKSLEAGLDLAMPHSEEHVEKLKALAKANCLDPQALDETAGKVIELAYKNQAQKALRKVDMSVEERYAAAEKVAEEGIVLLKNENHCLPLSPKETYLVTGAPCEWYVSGGGSSRVPPRNPFVPLEGALKENGLQVHYVKSVAFNHGAMTCMENFREAVKQGALLDGSIIAISQDDYCQSEAFDRQSLALSQEQVLLIQEIAAVSKKTIVLIYAGAPIQMSGWIDKVNAVVWVSYPGEIGNRAVARILSGAVNPSGKTTETFPLALDDVEAAHTHVDASCVIYSEGLNVGYRQFVSENKPVLFPFGYGLTYSHFVYGDYVVTPEGHGARISLSLTNDSDIDGKEIVQIYVGEIGCPSYRPKRELKAFQKVALKAHEKKKITFNLGESAFAYYSAGKGAWTRDEEGIFDVMVGSSCLEIWGTQRIKL